jgi:Pentapeptide repeats (8 copies)
LAERRLWFVRRNGEVKGPFMPAQITRNILLGRLKPDDELSSDEQHWQQVAMHRELYPDVLQESPVNDEKVDIAKIQVDERVADKRREKQKMAEDRRRTRDRRATESDAILVHRHHRKEVADACKNGMERPKIPILSILLIVIVIVGFGMLLKPEKKNLKSDCTLPPNTGVNWSNCNFINLNAENQNLEFAILTDAKLNESKLSGVNLSGSDMAYAEIIRSDLSYANLKNVRLIGANLQHSDLSYANLEGTDFSYADLSNALLAGADMTNTKLSNTIWIDGKICEKGSVGSCQ